MISTIIPVYNLDNYRKRNLEFIYERLIEAEIKVIIAIQDNKIDSYFNKFNKAKLVNFYKKDYEKKCNKSFLFNSCLSNLDFSEEYTLFLDCDVYLPFKDLKTKITNTDEIIQPFFECYYLNESSTNKFIKNREVELPPELKKTYNLGSCAFLIKTSLIKKIKFNEKFFSWGYRSVSFGEDSNKLKIRTIVQPAVHLYHKNFIQKKIFHFFEIKENYKEFIKSCLLNKSENVILVGMGNKDIKNKNIIFKKIPKKFEIKKAINFICKMCKKDDWILYTNSDFYINENLYTDISKYGQNYVEISGCELDISRKFLHSTKNANGFAIKKHLWNLIEKPKIFLGESNWNAKLSNHFENFKKINIVDQLFRIKINKKDNNEKFSESKLIMYFAPHAPNASTSGGDRLLKIFKILKKLNYEIHFLCNSYENLEDLNNLTKIGVNYYLSNEDYLIGHIKKFKSDKYNFNSVIFSWYDIATQYLHIVKELFPSTKIIVDSVDIHWKREFSGYLKGEIKITLDELEERKYEEKRIYSEADLVLVVTNNDKKEVMNKVNCNKNIKILSNIHDIKDNSNLGNDILFIGGFKHTPNVSAATDSIEIYKEFLNTDVYKKLNNKPKLYIVGSNIPEKIKDLCDGINCIALGYVENLDELYSNIKVSISPLTWGSGIKGKICDAACRGKVILTSDVGNEGINLKDKQSGYIANNKNEFVKKLEEIYSDNHHIKVAEEGKNIIKNLVSEEAAISVLKHTLHPKPITVVIVTHNKSQSLKRCIDSIIKNTEYKNYKIVVYDNASTDDTSEIINDLSQKNPNLINYIKSSINKFFLIPNNIIMKEENYLPSDLVLVNDDIEIISKCWLSRLYSAAYSEYNICSVGAKILYPDRTLSEAGSELYSDGTGRNIGRFQNPENPEFNCPRYVGYCSGCLLYMRRDAIEKLGVFDEDFVPMYYEESEWQYRAHLQGLKTLYEPKVEVIHHEDKVKEMKKYQYLNKNKFYNKYKNKNIEQYN